MGQIEGWLGRVGTGWLGSSRRSSTRYENLIVEAVLVAPEEGLDLLRVARSGSCQR